MLQGHMPIPNGNGFDCKLWLSQPAGYIGMKTNRLTYTKQRNSIAGTPLYNFVPALVEKIG